MGFKFDPKRVDRALHARIEKLLQTAGKYGLDAGCLPITQVGEAVLRQPCKQIRGQIEPELLRKLIYAMKTTMRKAPGVGLAAPQVGLNIALAVIEDTSVEPDFDPIAEQDPRETHYVKFFTAINPSYEPVVNENGQIQECGFYEGCLSFANHYALRYRYHKILARWVDEKGRDQEQVFEGWPARIFQHETDHLSGEIYIDKAVIRSLATAENLSEYQLDEHLERTAQEFGFPL
jgi:peptide deformylase